MKEFTKVMNRRIKVFITIIVAFIAIWIVSKGIQYNIEEYHNTTIRKIKNIRWEYIDNAITLINFGIEDKLEIIANNIYNEIENELDKEQLKKSLSDNKYYRDFNVILRRNLENPKISILSNLDTNRNSIFVLCNDKLISSYSHSDSLGNPFIPLEDDKKCAENDINTLINNHFYNKELSLWSLNKINDQHKGLILFQENDPLVDNLPHYTHINKNDLKEIYEKYGLDGLGSYEFLVPVYITEYGNVFGEYDTTMNKKRNKIIIIQKYNIKDYFDSFTPQVLYTSTIEDLESRYKLMENMLNIFNILLYIIMIIYTLNTVYQINITIDTIEDDIDEESNIKLKNKKNI